MWTTTKSPAGADDYDPSTCRELLAQLQSIISPTTLTFGSYWLWTQEPDTSPRHWSWDPVVSCCVWATPTACQIRIRPAAPLPVHLSTAWRNPSLLRCFWRVCHPKIPSTLGTSENHLGPSLDCMANDLHKCYAQMVLTSWMTFIIVVVVVVMEGKAKVIPELIGTTGTISKSFRQYLCNILGEHEIKVPQEQSYWALQTYFQKY